MRNIKLLITGIKFMFDCITGMKSDKINGCILADCMGLGKTLQIISLIHLISKQTPFEGKYAYIRKSLILCPLSLISNWKAEIKKFIGDMKLSPTVILFKSNFDTRIF